MQNRAKPVSPQNYNRCKDYNDLTNNSFPQAPQRHSTPARPSNPDANYGGPNYSRKVSQPNETVPNLVRAPGYADYSMNTPANSPTGNGNYATPVNPYGSSGRQSPLQDPMLRQLYTAQRRKSSPGRDPRNNYGPQPIPPSMHRDHRTYNLQCYEFFTDPEPVYGGNQNESSQYYGMPPQNDPMLNTSRRTSVKQPGTPPPYYGIPTAQRESIPSSFAKGSVAYPNRPTNAFESAQYYGGPTPQNNNSARDYGMQSLAQSHRHPLQAGQFVTDGERVFYIRQNQHGSGKKNQVERPIQLNSYGIEQQNPLMNDPRAQTPQRMSKSAEYDGKNYPRSENDAYGQSMNQYDTNNNLPSYSRGTSAPAYPDRASIDLMKHKENVHQFSGCIRPLFPVPTCPDSPMPPYPYFGYGMSPYLEDNNQYPGDSLPPGGEFDYENNDEPCTPPNDSFVGKEMERCIIPCNLIDRMFENFDKKSSQNDNDNDLNDVGGYEPEADVEILEDLQKEEQIGSVTETLTKRSCCPCDKKNKEATDDSTQTSKHSCSDTSMDVLVAIKKRASTHNPSKARSTEIYYEDKGSNEEKDEERQRTIDQLSKLNIKFNNVEISPAPVKSPRSSEPDEEAKIGEINVSETQVIENDVEQVILDVNDPYKFYAESMPNISSDENLWTDQSQPTVQKSNASKLKVESKGADLNTKSRKRSKGGCNGCHPRKNVVQYTFDTSFNRNNVLASVEELQDRLQKRKKYVMLPSREHDTYFPDQPDFSKLNDYSTYAASEYDEYYTGDELEVELFETRAQEPLPLMEISYEENYSYTPSQSNLVPNRRSQSSPGGSRPNINYTHYMNSIRQNFYKNYDDFLPSRFDHYINLLQRTETKDQLNKPFSSNKSLPITQLTENNYYERLSLLYKAINKINRCTFQPINKPRLMEKSSQTFPLTYQKTKNHLSSLSKIDILKLSENKLLDERFAQLLAQERLKNRLQNVLSKLAKISANIEKITSQRNSCCL